MTKDAHRIAHRLRRVYSDRMLELGPLRVEALHDGTFSLDGGAMFGVVPRALWEKQLAPDSRNRVRLALRCLLLRTQDRIALIDTGLGDKWDEKQRETFAIERTSTLLTGLAARGIAPEDVTDVVLTHLHFDHAGGVARRDASGALSLSFPRATHHLQRRNWEWAQAPTERDRGSYRPENFELLRGSARLRLLEGACEILPGVHALPTQGHTPGLQCLLLEGGGRTLLYPADLLPTSAHLRAAWGMSYDLQPLEVMREKRALLQRAAAEGSIVVFEHDPRLQACTVRPDKDGFALDREIAL
jgi:glyoxylase-like metal-dependent hydrolase (beta-lactamase superfamily II)